MLLLLRLQYHLETSWCFRLASETATASGAVVAALVPRPGSERGGGSLDKDGRISGIASTGERPRRTSFVRRVGMAGEEETHLDPSFAAQRAARAMGDSDHCDILQSSQ